MLISVLQQPGPQRCFCKSDFPNYKSHVYLTGDYCFKAADFLLLWYIFSIFKGSHWWTFIPCGVWINLIYQPQECLSCVFHHNEQYFLVIVMCRHSLIPHNDYITDTNDYRLKNHCDVLHSCHLPIVFLKRYKIEFRPMAA